MESTEDSDTKKVMFIKDGMHRSMQVEFIESPADESVENTRDFISKNFLDFVSSAIESELLVRVYKKKVKKRLSIAK